MKKILLILIFIVSCNFVNAKLTSIFYCGCKNGCDASITMEGYDSNVRATKCDSACNNLGGWNGNWAPTTNNQCSS